MQRSDSKSPNKDYLRNEMHFLITKIHLFIRSMNFNIYKYRTEISFKRELF